MALDKDLSLMYAYAVMHVYKVRGKGYIVSLGRELNPYELKEVHSCYGNATESNVKDNLTEVHALYYGNTSVHLQGGIEKYKLYMKAYTAMCMRG